MAPEIVLGVVAFALLVIIVYLVWLYNSRNRTISDLRASIQDEARGLFDGWRKTELDGIRLQYADVAQREAKTLSDQWAFEWEEEIRKDAIQRSMAVVTGKVTEHVAPFLPAFKYNPKDTRFIGSPIDLVVFDGYSEGEPRQVVFVEVKTGSSALSTKERKLRDLIQARVVSWEELHVPLATPPGETVAALEMVSAPHSPEPLPEASTIEMPISPTPPAPEATGRLSRQMSKEEEGAKLTTSRADALERMTLALETAKRARDSGRNVTEVRKALKQARAAFEIGDYAAAFRLANESLTEL